MDITELNENSFCHFLWNNLTTRDRVKVLQSKKRTIWLFGAGASCHYALNNRGVNMPLARDFFKAMHRLPTTDGFNAYIGPLISYLHKYRGVHPINLSEWTEDIEQFMTSIENEIDLLRKKKEKKELNEDEYKKFIALSTVFDNMTFIFSNVINEAQDGSSYSAYAELLKFCGQNDTFITFNWDTLLDKALAASGAWLPNEGYCVDFGATFDGRWKKRVDSSPSIECNWRLLKLHGSTNWLVPYTGIHQTTFKVQSIIPKNDKVFLFWQASMPYETFKGRWRGGYGPTCYGYYPPHIPASSFSKVEIAVPKGRALFTVSYKGIFAPFSEPSVKGIPSSPLLITPVRQKRYDDYIGIIKNLWNLAKKSLEEADKIVAIGYSFPLTDTKALALLRNILSKRKNQIELTIVDPFADIIAERIGDNYIKSAKSVSLHNMIFEEYINALWQEAPMLIKTVSENNAEFKEWVERLRAFQNWPKE
ncbi:MAG: hypothetical protein EHM20_05185 [Alphaproteobacteria bacterium]|nr:MAG: hypothetical protein EHM20_05185 [Alphaproteobacteria bacterium]